MNAPSLNAELIASHLSEHPEFFVQHKELFAQLKVPHPHEQRAISLAERQILNLREQNKTLQQRLQQLVNNARKNQEIHSQVLQFAATLCSVVDAHRLLHTIPETLQQLFRLDHAALYTWGEFSTDKRHDTTNTLEACPTQSYTQQLQAPFCGDCTDHPLLHLLPQPILSICAIPLHSTSEQTAGILLLGSHQPERFNANMALDFIKQIALLTSASLQRTITPPTT